MTFDYINGNNQLLNNDLNRDTYIFDFDKEEYILIKMKDSLGNIIEKRFEIDEISPNIYVYPSSADEVNLDFSTIGNNLKFTYEYDNGNLKVENIDITSKTYTLKYNYNTDITVTVMNSEGNIITRKIFTPDSVRNRGQVMPVDQNTLPDNIEIENEYFYLKGSILYKGYLESTKITDDEGYVSYVKKMKEEVIDGENEYLNIYNGKALRNNGTIYDVKKLTTTISEESELLKTTINHLDEYTYNGQIIKRYGTYSTVNGVNKEYIYLVVDNNLDIMPYINSMTIDNFMFAHYKYYAPYQFVLMKNNVIENYKRYIIYPNGYANSNILLTKGIMNTTQIMIMYLNGQVVVFDYKNGNLIYDSQKVEKETNNISLFSFISEKLNLDNINIFNNSNKTDEELQEKYEIATNIQEQLSEVPIEVAMNNLEITDENGEKPKVNQEELMNREYVTVYNPKTDDYEVFKETELLDSEIEEPESETSKIQKQAQLNEYYYSNAKKNIEQTGSIYVYIILVVIIISLFILKKYYKGTTSKRK